MLNAMGVTLEDLQNGRRTRPLADARCMMAAWLKKQPKVRQEDIAEFFGTSQAAVSKMLARHRNLMDYNAVYRTSFEQIINSINNPKQIKK